ncbi:hypothetical protein [Streptomyces sp. NBC_00140]|uniref:hypothetical protein n=1 Tax=Streptomyces sp. NBC_00140 TaxID=2975664 RepID=UPI00224FA39B|nr:hypothetical protein [Streptomyces sp. NBC_00140]MCX5327849.1 hypothetical protein [Streptomyces sp. NBC_00140]
MDPATTAVVTMAGAVITAITTIASGWLKARVQLRRSREESRQKHVRTLPTGSRIIDLGERGIIIEVGGKEGRAGGRR